MKTPRVKDFDPNAKAEPVLKSSLDNMPVIAKPPSQDYVSKRTPVPVGTLPQTKKRYMKQRHPFDIYGHPPKAGQPVVDRVL